MPDTPDESSGREEQVSGNVQGYVRVLHWARASKRTRSCADVGTRDVCVCEEGRGEG